MDEVRGRLGDGRRGDRVHELPRRARRWPPPERPPHRGSPRISAPIRVMVADDEPAIREDLCSLIEDDRGITLVGAGKDADEAIAIASSERPDVALLDVRMPAGGGRRAAREIARLSPGTRIIALSATDDPGDVRAMLDVGAAGYLVKGEDSAEIVDAINRSVVGPEGHARWAALLPTALGTSGAASRERLRQIEALVRGEEIGAVFQPIFDLDDGRPVGVEALCRVSAMPQRPPDHWFAEAAAVGLGIELEVTAARIALQALDRTDPSIALGINVSPDAACSDELRDLLADVSLERVVLEITEHAPVSSYERLNEALAPLRARGVRLAIDDTCSGYASLRHVLYLKPEVIKLDGTLTAGVETDEPRRSLVRSLVAFAPSVGAEVLAEGIESPAQLEALRAAGVPMGQGYLLGRPGPLPDAGTWERWGEAA